MEAAYCYAQTSFASHEAATCYVSAAMCFAKENIEVAVKAMERAVEYYKENGRFSMVAKYEKEMAEMYESQGELGVDNAMKYYESAAEFFLDEGSTASASTCLLKIAHVAADQQDFHKAIQNLEKILVSANKTTTWTAREILLKAGLCHLCLGDTVATRKFLEYWGSIVVDFVGSHEHRFLSDVVTALENFDHEGLQDIAQEHATLLSNEWKQKLFGKIRQQIEEEQEEDLR